MKAAIVFIVIFLRTLMSVAQPCTYVRGTITDAETRERLPGANIRLEADWRTGTSTDSLGHFIIKAQAGDTLVASFIGYKESAFIIRECEIVILLEPYAQLTGEVVVKAERLIAEEFRTMKADKLDIYTNPTAKADPLLAVNAMPAATTLDESANISLRGSTAQETGIFLNNVPIYDGIRYGQLNGIGTFSIFNTAIINNVQVFPGNPPLEYGNTSSGLIALQTDALIPKKTETQLSLNMASVGFSTQIPVKQKSSISVFGNHQFSGLLRGLNPRSLERIKNFGSQDLGLHYFYRFSPTTSLKFFNYSLREQFTFDFRQPSFHGDFNAQGKRNFSTLSLQKRVGKGEFSINQGASFSESRFSYSVSDIKPRNTNFFTSFNYLYTGNWFDFKTGISHDNRLQKFNGTLPEIDFAIAPIHPFFNISSTTRIAITEVFGYGKYRFSEKIMIGAGMRQNIPARMQPLYNSLQANVKWQMTEKFSLLLGAGKYHRTDFSRGAGNATLFFETDQLSLDATYKTLRWEVIGSVFGKHSRQDHQLIETVGAEAFIKYQSRKWLAQISVSSLQSTIQQNEISFASPFDLSYFGRANLQYKFGGNWVVSAFSLFRQGSFFRPVAGAQFNPLWMVYEPRFVPVTGQQRLPAYFNMSMNVSKVISLSDKLMMVFFASVDNLTNNLNVRDYNYNFDYTTRTEERFAQRTAFLGCVLNF